MSSEIEDAADRWLQIWSDYIGFKNSTKQVTPRAEELSEEMGSFTAD